MTIYDKKISNHDLLNHDLILYFLLLIQTKQKTEAYNLGFLHGGDGRDRTDDLHTASVALSQLSYAPMSCDR